ncbi:hypothetical protein [Polynucleobacter necessarius]|uniref:hypothetical protein n=1 Tax=Polynucleobacter necessarius TaxID=576610 RepID=UPI000E08EB2F|nr:hypothetical protein [Polynucleobacter necessarius]
MSEISKIMERVIKSLNQVFNKMMALLGWLVIIFQSLALALYKQLRYDFDLVWMRIRGSSKNSQGRPISSAADVKEVATQSLQKNQAKLLVPFTQSPSTADGGKCFGSMACLSG